MVEWKISGKMLTQRIFLYDVFQPCFSVFQELSLAHQSALTELATCFGEGLPESLPGCGQHPKSLPEVLP